MDIGLNALTVGFAGAAAYSSVSKIGTLADGLNNGGYVNFNMYQRSTESSSLWGELKSGFQGQQNK